MKEVLYLASERLPKDCPSYSAKYLPIRRYGCWLVGVVGLVGWGLYHIPGVLCLVIEGCFLAMVGFRFGLFLGGKQVGLSRIEEYEKNRKEQVDREGSEDTRNLPYYSVLVPLFKESTILPSLINALQALRYPKAKLDIKLILEEEDGETLAVLRKMHLPTQFEIITVPYSFPQTKPKACNYALQFAKGMYVTIYDAEDVPDPYQLIKVLQVFAREGEEVACVQARLNYYNREVNWLTKLFAIEYAVWFDYCLIGLHRFGGPIPLGGTSNHFRTGILQAIGGWDAYNVTEDADIGVRLACLGKKVALVDSVTLEEAPSSLSAWIKQRGRWLKGYMQTWAVHMKHQKQLYRQLGIKGILAFHLFIGLPPLCFLIGPMLWGIWFVELYLPDWLLLGLGISLATMVISYFYTAIVVMRREKWCQVILYALLFTLPVYWLLHSMAGYRALYQFFRSPFHWDKTVHKKGILG